VVVDSSARDGKKAGRVGTRYIDPGRRSKIVGARAYKVISEMPDTELKILILRLAKYALGVSRNLDWRTQNPRQLPDGETIDSIVSKAFEKVLSGERNWDPELDPSLEKYLMNVIDSLLNHLAESVDNKIFTIPTEQTGDASVTGVRTIRAPGGAEWLAQRPQNPEELVLAQEREKDNEKALETLITECGNDPVLIKVLEAMFDGCCTARAIAERLRIAVDEVYKANRRLDAKLASVRRKMTGKVPLPVEKGNDVRH
jgi:hypothetical protein